jgi:hypothetical protein
MERLKATLSRKSDDPVKACDSQKRTKLGALRWGDCFCAPASVFFSKTPGRRVAAPSLSRLRSPAAPPTHTHPHPRRAVSDTRALSTHTLKKTGAGRAGDEVSLEAMPRTQPPRPRSKRY